MILNHRLSGGSLSGYYSQNSRNALLLIMCMGQIFTRHYGHAVYIEMAPPSMTSSEPVTYEESSDAR